MEISLPVMFDLRVFMPRGVIPCTTAKIGHTIEPGEGPASEILGIKSMINPKKPDRAKSNRIFVISYSLDLAKSGKNRM